MRLCLSGVVRLCPQVPQTLMVLTPLFCICHWTTRALVDHTVSNDSVALTRRVIGQAGRLRSGEDARHQCNNGACASQYIDNPWPCGRVYVYIKDRFVRSKHDGERRCSIAVNALHLYPHGATCKDPWFKSEHRLCDRCCAHFLCVNDSFLTLCFYPHQRCRAAPPAAAAVRVGVVLALPTDVVSGTRPRP